MKYNNDDLKEILNDIIINVVWEKSHNFIKSLG